MDEVEEDEEEMDDLQMSIDLQMINHSDEHDLYNQMWIQKYWQHMSGHINMELQQLNDLKMLIQMD